GSAVRCRDGPGAGMLYGAGGACGVRPSRALSVAGGVAGLSHAGVGHRAATIPKGPVARGGRGGGAQTGGSMGAARLGKTVLAPKRSRGSPSHTAPGGKVCTATQPPPEPPRICPGRQTGRESQAIRSTQTSPIGGGTLP